MSLVEDNNGEAALEWVRATIRQHEEALVWLTQFEQVLSRFWFYHRLSTEALPQHDEKCSLRHDRLDTS